MKNLIIIAFFLSISYDIFSQETFPVNDVQDERTKAYAFTNATIFVDYQTKIDNGTLLIRDGKVVNAGSGITIPEGYVTVDLAGKYIYPSMIDMYTTYGIPPVKREGGSPFNRPEQIVPDDEGPYNANEAIKSYYNAWEDFKPDNKKAESWRKEGFGTLLVFRPDGLARGSSALVTVGSDNANLEMINSRVAAHYSFNKGSSSQSYPFSRMGFIATLRQTYLDAEWYRSLNEKPFTDKALDGWIQSQTLPQIFETGDWKGFLRADKVGDEFGKQYIIKGSGDEYKRIDLIKNTNASVIVPLNFPDAYDVEDPFETARTSLADMKHWELAPTNAGVLEKNNINFALTSHGLKKKSDFRANLIKAIEHGLSKQTALKALTYTPANLLRVYNQVGSLHAGKTANFIITSGDLFDKKAIIYENWIQGKKYFLKDLDVKDFSGIYSLNVGDDNYNMEISGEPGKHQMKINVNDSTEIKVNSKIEGELINLRFSPEGEEGEIRLSGWLSGERNWKGNGQLIDGTWVSWSATFSSEKETPDRKSDGGENQDEKDLGPVIYPFVAYGTPELPKQETILIKNATVWTNEADGVLENTDVLIQNGKISQIGQNINVQNARVIDGTGKHLTPGIIDEHSHIALDGVNDVATNSSMVRMKDVVDPESVSIYRALAGGVTAAQLLHGSANPIGGQSAIIKLRWGSSPQRMLISNADEFIKFALGENVKRSSNQRSVRYPQTRMGVEQVYVDAFTEARDYQQKWNNYNSLSSRAKADAVRPRRDLAMDAMVEILNGRRFITCHSYVQSEINMLMKVAEQFNFRVNTFTHILEGYKVADKMADHGAGGSTFSDWWAYKWEVRYAIPYNAALMNNEGVVVAINSDSSEMIRRLNQEAGKSIKYGGLTEEEALKLVTLNPAKLLHLDDRMGSIKVGNDADVVLWSDKPLSIYAKAEKTIIDGTVYYDIEKDEQLREDIRKERARLVQKMQGVKKSGGRTQGPQPRIKVEWQCEDLFEIDMNRFNK